MSLNEEFDELARRKLEERAFPFQEADWQDAHARIDAQRDGRGRAAWILSAGLLLLMGGALWLGTRPAATESPIAAVVSEGVTAPNVGITSIPKERDASSEPIGKTNDAAVPGASRRAEPAEVVEKRTVPSEASSVAATASVKTITSRSATSSPAVPATQPRSAKSEPGERDQDQAQEKIVMMVANIPATVLADDAVTSETPETTHADPQGSIEGKGASTEPGIPTTPAEVRADNGPGSLKTTTVSSDQGQRTINEDVAAQRTTTAVTGQEDAAKDAVLQGPKDVPSIAVSNESSDRVTTGEGFANEQPLNAPPLNSDSNSTATAKMLAPSDSAAPIAPTLPAPLPLVPERAPWEISAMGGVFNSKSHYSGGNSADWTGNISSERSLGIGAEIMHMGRNIGIGTVLHYASYA